MDVHTLHFCYYEPHVLTNDVYVQYCMCKYVKSIALEYDARNNAESECSRNYSLILPLWVQYTAIDP